MRIVLIILLIINAFEISAQVLSQTIRGIVVDKFSNAAIAEAKIILQANDSLYTYTTSTEGVFTFTVPIGRYTILAQKENYNTYLQKDIILNSTKEIILNIELDEKVVRKIEDVKITGAKEKHKSINDANLVSTRQLSVDEANRFAGSLGDPARMVQNFAGVQANGDRRNDIIVRGNSPLGVSWRLEGIEIPNPNHFSGVGLTGGTISIVNNNNLSNSDFLTGAFAPQYGNAIAGVFDLRLKNGNNKKREYMAQFGMNGLEFGAEGPISKKNNSSYIVNVRYSTLEIFDALKINLGANGQAAYRDATFKLHFPTKKYGTLSIWGIGGYNTVVSYSKNYDTTGKKLNPRPKGFDVYFNNAMAAIGATYMYKISPTINVKANINYSYSYNGTDVDSLFNNETEKMNWLGRSYNDHRINIHTALNKKWSTKQQTQVGIYYTQMFFNIKDSIWYAPLSRYFSLLSFNGAPALSRAYLQHSIKFTDKWQLVGGMHFSYFSLNKHSMPEARLAVKWQASQKLFLHAGAGMHNQLQPLTTYFFNRTGLGNTLDSFTNMQLDFIKSNHLVLGAEYIPFKDYRVKAEVYYQNLYDAAVENKPTSYSTLNEGAFYYMIPKPFNVNGGTGYNYGAELTVEKFFSKQFYFLITGSLYQSKYKGSDAVLRNTAFNGNYTFATLAGYEYKLTKNNSLNINLRLAVIGGRRYSPIDTNASKLSGNTEFVDSAAYSLRYPDYIRPDIKASYRINRKHTSHEIGINIDNFINRQNIQSVEYDNYTKKVGYSYQNGLFPVLQYKVEF
jgi:hypothetical protein